MKKFYLMTTTEGCATNLLENSTYRKELEATGLKNSENIDEADCVVINTCGYTQEREDHTKNVVSRIKNDYPDKEMIIGGCLAKINPQSLEGLYEGDFFSPGDTKKVRDLVGGASLQSEDPVPPTDTWSNQFDSADFVGLTWVHKLVIKLRPYFFSFENLIGRKLHPLHNVLDSTIVNKEYYCLTVSQGCAGRCSFCAIKVAKGKVKSRPLLDILHEFQRGIDQGYKKFWLLGDDIGCYGIDRGETLVDLLREILAIPTDFTLVINYTEPLFFLKYFDDLKPLLKDKRVVNVNIPLQSGSPSIVKLMERDYDPHTVCEKISELKKENPSIVIKNNIIVGFPKESMRDFWDSVKSVFSYDVNLALKFTPRTNTKAARMTDVIPSWKIWLRHKIINVAIVLRHAYIFTSSMFRGEKITGRN